MITIGIIYGLMAVLYLVVALINARNNALIDKTSVCAWLGLILMTAIWPIALILDTITWWYIHK